LKWFQRLPDVILSDVNLLLFVGNLAQSFGGFSKFTLEKGN